MKLEFIRTAPWRPSARPPLVFVHGAYSGAWVWQPHFQPFFGEHGWNCLAVSLRGHGDSAGGDRLHQWGLADYVEDVRSAISEASGGGVPPVVVGHSLASLIVQRAVSGGCRASGMVLLAGAPPAGMAGLVAWMAWRHPGLFWQLNRLQAFGRQPDPEVLYESLFTPGGMPPEKALAYLPLIQNESRRALMEAMLPLWLSEHARPAVPTLVIGGDADHFIPVHDLHAAARYWNADLRILAGVPHTPMLDEPTWRQAADAILDWLEGRFGKTA